MSLLGTLNNARRRLKAAGWKRAGRSPGASGYGAARWLAIEHAVSGASGDRYGWDDAGIDERVVEYAWAFQRVAALNRPGARALDAGSVLNYPSVLEAWRRASLPPVSIVTLAPEGHAEVSDRVRYEYADLRRLPYRDAWFDVVLCVSTLEHVGLDNTIYGAASDSAADPTAEVSAAVRELHRVTVRGGTLLATVPFGARSNRGWFRIFDAEDLRILTNADGWMLASARYFRQTREGWRECTADDARSSGYNEPRTRPGQQTAPAWVGGAEAVALVELTRA